jgi:PAS domain S-box-containing protein
MEYLSEGFAAISGYSVADIMEFKKITYNDIIHPDYREYLWERWQDLLAINSPLEEEYPIVTKNGETRWVWERGRGVYDDNESLIYLEGFIADITERKRNEQIQKMLYDISTAVLTTNNLEELIENIRKQLGNLLDTSNFYVAFYDEITGMFYTPHAVDQKDNMSAWPAEKSLTGYLIRQKKALLISEEEYLSLVDSGEIKIIGTPAKLWLGVPLQEDEMIIGAFVVQSYDNPNAYTTKDVEMLEFISHQISLFVQRKRAEGKLKNALAKAEESDRLKSAFLATMNHELRTPLNHILGFSELILSGVMPEDNQSFASSIHMSGKNLLSIVEDVFDLALAEQSNVKLRLQTFCLMDQFMENKSSFDHILQSSGKAEQIQLVFKPDKRLLSMYLTVDRGKVNQVLVNLFKNAVKFTNSGTIEFGYQSKEPDKLTFFIKDTGIGIPEVKQSLIFDFFRQGDDSPTRVYGGAGIGLAIALKITRILKGELSVVSKVDHGSTFYLTVPVELADVNN